MKIEKTSDAANAAKLTFLIYGDPKMGKTTMCRTLPRSSDSKVMYVAADPGQLALRDVDFNCVKPTSAEFMEEFHAFMKKHQGEYEYIVIDGIDDVGQMKLWSLTRGSGSKIDGRQAYGEMADSVEIWLRQLRSLSPSLILISHMSEVQDEERTRFQPLFPGRTLTARLPGMFDEIGCLRMVKVATKDGPPEFKRMVQFRPEGGTNYTVGDRSGSLDSFEPPDFKVIFGKVFGKTTTKNGEK